jgi:hypothetical protein
MVKAGFDPMEHIWERLPKERDGKTVRYLLGDIAYLYKNGFVDTKQHTYEQWKAALLPHQKTDGSYILTKEAFLSLRKYRLGGVEKEPFDPMKLAEGPWDEARVKALYHKAIKPSSEVPEEIFWNSIAALKRAGCVDETGRLIINEKAKNQITYLIERFPSARRRLEKEVSRLRQEKDQILIAAAKNRNASGFSIGITESEYQLNSFQKLQSSLSEDEQEKDIFEEDLDADEEEMPSIKDLRKPPSRVRG